MSSQECPRARRRRAALTFLLALVVALAASCSNPEKAKAEHVRRGEAMLKEQRWQEATLEFRNALQIDNNLAAAHWGLAQAYEKLGRVAELIEELQQTAKLDPTNAEARLKLANAYLLAYARNKNQELLAQAEQYAEQIIAHDAKNPDGHILLANVVFLKGGPDAARRAEQMIKEAVALNPQRVESHVGLAKFYLLNNRPQEAEATYRQAISLNDRSSAAHYEYARFLVQTGRSDQAEAEFRRAVEVDPENRDVRWMLASYYLVNKQFDKAEAAYREWAQLDWDKPEGKSRLADYYATVGRYDEAANLYQEIVKAAPDYSRGRYRLGEISLQRGDAAGAEAQVNELLKVNQRDMNALFLRSRLHLGADRWKKAAEDLKSVLDQDPRNRLGLYFMSEALYRDGQLEQARARTGELERFHPDFLPAKLLQVQISLDSGDYDAAKRLADDLLKRLEETPEKPSGEQTPQLVAEVRTNARVLRGKAGQGLKQLGPARADFEAARQLAPNSPLPYVNLADVAFAEGKRDEAWQHLERALSISPNYFQALNGLIRLGAVTNRLGDVRARLEQATAEQPRNAPLLYLLGQSYRYGNEQQPPDSQRAESAMRRALEADPDYVAAYSALGEIYFSSNQADRAIAEYQKVAERRPDSVDPIVKIGLIESGRQNLDAAEQYYRRVLAIKPGEPVASNNLAMLYADHGRGNPDEAMRLAQDIVRRHPNEPGFADTLGWVYYRKGLHAAAVEQLQRAVAGAAKSGGDNSLYRWHLGAALAAKGDKAAARRELQKCLELAAAEQQRALKPVTGAPVDDVRRTLERL